MYELRYDDTAAAKIHTAMLGCILLFEPGPESPPLQGTTLYGVMPNSPRPELSYPSPDQSWKDAHRRVSARDLWKYPGPRLKGIAPLLKSAYTVYTGSLACPAAGHTDRVTSSGSRGA